MENENETSSGISFDFSGTLVTVHHARFTVRVLEENDRLLAMLYDV